MSSLKKDYFFQNVRKLNGVGTQLSKYLKRNRENKRYFIEPAIFRNR